MILRIAILSVMLIQASLFAGTPEDFESASPGHVRDFKAWHAADIKPGAEIVDLKDNTYNKVLKLNASKSKPFTAFYRFTPAASGKLIIDFDFKTNSFLAEPRVAVAVKGSSLKMLPYQSSVWLGIGYDKKLCYFSQGWRALDSFALDKWHHVKLIIYISGGKAGTFDLNLDGGEFEGLGLNWRNKLNTSPDKPFGLLFFQLNKNEKFSGNEYLMIDNVRAETVKTEDAPTAVKQAAKAEANVYNGTFFSKVLNKQKNFTAVIPTVCQAPNKKYPVLYLFHGRGRNERSLVDSPEALAEFAKAKFITVFPDGDDGWYINSPVKKQDRYNDYIEELMTYAESKLPISTDPAQRGISGWSMGGYGCTMFAEAHADQFSALAPMIALLDYPRSGLPKGQSYRKLPDRFGSNEQLWKKFNPINNAARLKGKNILIITGQKCFTLTMNKNFVAELKKLNIPCEFKILKGGHAFATVLEAVPQVVDFMNHKLK